jgi:hypothetical protein
VRWFSTPAFLACLGGAHDRGEGVNVLEGARTAEVWAQTAEGGGGGARFSGGHARLGGGVHGRGRTRQGAHTAWGGAHGRGLAGLQGVGAGRGVWGVCFFIISFGFFFA